jgi:hypothetical protein
LRINTNFPFGDHLALNAFRYGILNKVVSPGSGSKIKQLDWLSFDKNNPVWFGIHSDRKCGRFNSISSHSTTIFV